ncbi:hypothetical protein [Burkholderia gladioli]|uniref:hypothetical protein n=1 Tax=Burkholderia gladioli TaxID=28095 RepID=UPI0030CB93C8
MDKLLRYLNSLDRPQRKDFCDRIQTTEGYLRKACSTKQSLHPKLCSRIERESGGQVKRLDLLSEAECIEIWPDLAKALLDQIYSDPPLAEPVATNAEGG